MPRGSAKRLCYNRMSGIGTRATQSRQSRQVRKEATVTGQCVCSGRPGAWRLAVEAGELRSQNLQVDQSAIFGAIPLSQAARPQVRAKISALGTYVPPRLLTNADLEKMVETSDKWIRDRTGIRERHIVSDGMATSDLAVEAAKKALAARGIEASDLDAIIVSTVTPDMFFPST